MAGLLSELAFAFPTHEDNDAHGTQNPCEDEPANPEAVPVIVERTVFIFWVVGIQGRQAWWGEAGKERDGGAGLGKAGSKAMEPLASAKGPLMDSSPHLEGTGVQPQTSYLCTFHLESEGFPY